MTGPGTVRGRWHVECECGYESAFVGMIQAESDLQTHRDIDHGEGSACPHASEHPLMESCGSCGYRCQRTPARWKDVPCGRCGHQVRWVECPPGEWWAHYEHPEDGHDAQPVVYLLASDPAMVMPDGG